MIVSGKNTQSSWVDPDDAPELTDEWFQKADLMIGDKIIRRGRPPGSSKDLVSLRLDKEVIEHFRASGPGWQTRMNDALRKAAGL
ncbi:MAG TPA: BrnA antitoxin family protein [Sphingomicrobium sp.]|nr:BrnA antitoxin family protein [Sphingomicrobium sp.]